MNHPLRSLSSGKFLRSCISSLLAPALLIACSQQTGPGAQQPPPKPPAPVRTAQVVTKDMPLKLDVVGTVEAYATVNLMPQVTGQISKIHFKEGGFVKRGDLLFTIDPEPFRIALNEAEALLAKDEAQLENARTQEARYGDLVKKGYVSREQYDQTKTSASLLAASAQADKAAIENARLQLRYCSISSPISGRTGSLFLDVGNTVKPNDKPLVTIYQVEPIYASFSVPQQYLPDIKKFMAEGKLSVHVSMPDKSELGANGKLTFVDNAVDPSTGTIRLKAEFPNGDRHLWPGLFVQTTLFLTVEKGVTVVPTTAVVAGQKGHYAFVVKPDGTAENRILAVRRAEGPETVIDSGLNPGETVVIDGQLQVLPGGKVKVIDGSSREGTPRK